MVQVKLVVTDASGRVVRETCKDNDIALNNWTTWLGNLFNPVSHLTVGPSFTLTDTSNASRTMRSASYAHDEITLSTESSAINLGPKIGIGSSAVAPARTDYKLGTEISTGYTSAGASGGGAFAVARAFLNTSGSPWSVREVLLSMVLCDTSGAQYSFAMFHDDITLTTVNDGETITVTYTLSFP